MSSSNSVRKTLPRRPRTAFAKNKNQDEEELRGPALKKKKKEQAQEEGGKASSSSSSASSCSSAGVAVDPAALSFAQDLLQSVCRVPKFSLPRELVAPSSYESLLGATRDAIQSNLRVVAVVINPYDGLPNIALYHQAAAQDTTNALIKSMDLDSHYSARGSECGNEGYKHRSDCSGGSRDGTKVVRVLKVQPFPAHRIRHNAIANANEYCDDDNGGYGREANAR